jgi:menaquinone-dependent protoporphyrinogen oxidase
MMASSSEAPCTSDAGTTTRVRFLSKHRRKLSELPLAVFALGPTTAEPDDLAEARAQLDKALLKVREVEPSSVAVFGGVIDPARLRFPLNRMPASDARDWDAITAWAKAI